MSSPTTRLAYKDCYDLLDRALDEPRGIRFQVPSSASAISLRIRMHQARTIDREDNRRIYSPEESMHGCSVYDPLQIRYRTDGEAWWVYIEPRSVPIIGEIESLSETEETPWVQSQPPKLISHSGNEPTEKRLESTSSAPIDDSSSKNSTKRESDQGTHVLRRL